MSFRTDFANFQKTIIWLAQQNAIHGSLFTLEESELIDFASFFEVEPDDLKVALSSPYEPREDHFHYLFNIVYTSYLIKRKIKGMYDDIETGHFNVNNYHKLKQIEGLMDSLNRYGSEYMCLEENNLSWKYASQTWELYHPIASNIFLYLQDVIMENDTTHDLECRFLIDVLLYEMKTRSEAIYLSYLPLIIANSPFCSEEEKIFAEKLFAFFNSNLSNTRCIGAQFETRPVENDDPDKRGKKDRTSRASIVYGYDNYDYYCIRMDLPHSGNASFHINEVSPGCGRVDGYNSVPLSKDDYFNLLEHEKWLNEDFFVELGGVYYLKCKENIKLSPELEKKYEEIAKENHYSCISNDSISEESVISVFDVYSYFEGKYDSTIDVEYSSAKRLFQYDRIMTNMSLMSSLMAPPSIDCLVPCQRKDEINRLADWIIDAAARYEIIDASWKPSANIFEDICLISDEARSRANFLQY